MSGKKSDLVIGLLLLLLVLQCYRLLVHRPVVVATGSLSPAPAPVSKASERAARPSSASSSSSPAAEAPGRQVELHVPDYMRALVLLEAQPGLALSGAQAREILVRLKRFSGIYDRIPACEAAIYQTLTPEQLAALGRVVRATPPAVRQGPPELVHGPMAEKGLRFLNELLAR